MDAVPATVHMTATEFLAIPEDSTARRFELIDGELVVSEPTLSHNGAQIAIASALRIWSRGSGERGLAGLPLDVLIDDRNVYAPDVVWYCSERAPKRTDPRPYAVPDLVVEVRSPSTWRFDIGRKKQQYERHGVGELWLVDTAANVVYAFRRSVPIATRFDVSLDFGPGESLTSPLLEGFALAVDEIFELD